MHGDILCFTTNPDKYVTQSEDDLYHRLHDKVDYVKSVPLDADGISKQVKVFATGINAAYDGNCIIIDDPDKYYSDYIAHTVDKIKDIVNNTRSNKLKLRSIEALIGNTLPYEYVYSHDMDIILNTDDFIKMYFPRKKKPLRLYLMEVFDIHV